MQQPQTQTQPHSDGPKSLIESYGAALGEMGNVIPADTVADLEVSSEWVF